VLITWPISDLAAALLDASGVARDRPTGGRPFEEWWDVGEPA